MAPLLPFFGGAPPLLRVMVLLLCTVLCSTLSPTRTPLSTRSRSPTPSRTVLPSPPMPYPPPQYTISTVAGTALSGESGSEVSPDLDYPRSVLVTSGAGDFLFTDMLNNRIRFKNVSTGLVTTVAGYSASPFQVCSQTAGSAVNAVLNGPNFLAQDSVGNLFVSEAWGNAVRRISVSTFQITLYAGLGTGEGGFSGDGMAATLSRLDWVSGLAFGPDGVLYLSDTNNHRVRAVSIHGNITTVVGTGECNFSGDGGASKNAAVRYPAGLAVAFGVLFVADNYNNRIRAVSMSTWIITTLAGSGEAWLQGGFGGDGGLPTQATLSYPFDIAVDSSRNVFFTETGNKVVRFIGYNNNSYNVIHTIAGNGLLTTDGVVSTLADIGSPLGLSLSSSGSVYFTNEVFIRKLTPCNGMCSSAPSATRTPTRTPTKHTPSRTPSSSSSFVPAPQFITTVIAGGNDNDNYNTQFAGNGDGGPAIYASMTPWGVLMLADGSFFVADIDNNRVRYTNVSTGIISTYAGTGWAPYSDFSNSIGDGGPASSANLSQPSALAQDAFGNLYVALNYRIRRINAHDTVITTYAGGGFNSESIGDCGPATQAYLGRTAGIVFGANGELYISEQNRVRVVSSAGIITTVAGSGYQGFGGDNGPATVASLSLPGGLAYFAGSLFIADKWNNRIRLLNISTGVITTFAGSGNLATEPDSFISDTPGLRIGYTGDGGPATEATLDLPHGLAVDAVGNVYIADTLNSAIRFVSASSGHISTAAGFAYEYNNSGEPGSIPVNPMVDQTRSTAAALVILAWPTSVSISPSGQIAFSEAQCGYYIGSVTCFSVRTLTPCVGGCSQTPSPAPPKPVPKYSISTVAGNGNFGSSGDGGPATEASFQPFGVLVSPTGDVYISDYENSNVRVISASNGIITMLVGATGPLNDGGPAENSSVYQPRGLALDSFGNLFIAEYGGHRVRRVSMPTYVINTYAGTGSMGFFGDGAAASLAQLACPSGLAIDPAGVLYISDSCNHRIRAVSTTGVISTIAGMGVPGFNGNKRLATTALLNYPSGIAFAAGMLYIVDQSNVRRVDLQSGFIFAFYSGAAPSNVAVDSTGNVFVTEVESHIINVVLAETDYTSSIYVIAGNYVGGFIGDGDFATASELNYPIGLATTNSSRSVWVADSGNLLIRKLSLLASNTPTRTATISRGASHTRTSTPRPTRTSSSTKSVTPVRTQTRTAVRTLSATAAFTPTMTAVRTITPASTRSKTASKTPSVAATTSRSPTLSRSLIPSSTSSKL